MVETVPIGTQRLRDWDPVRKAYFERCERPTYAELSAEFSIPENSVRSIAASEGWAMLRAQRLEVEAARTDALAVVIEAAKGEKLLIDAFKSAVLVMVRDLLGNVEAIRDEKKAARRLALNQTASFTALNLAQALKALGVVGVPKRLLEAMNESGERGADWKQGALAQLNVLVQTAGGASVSVSGGQKPVETEAK